AHDYWIMPDTFYPSANSMLKVIFTCSHKYFISQEIPDITKYKFNLLTPEGRQFPITYSKVRPEGAWIFVPIFGSGTYVVSATSIAPSYWSQTPEGWIPEPKSAVKEAVKGGKYIKSVKLFLRVGRKVSNSYKKVFGYPIEIVPQKDPTLLKVGENLPLRVLYYGKPLNNVTVFAIYDGYKTAEKGMYPIKTKTDRNGVANVKLDRPGKWLIGAKYQFDIKGNPDADYENCRAYIMFKIKE
ncbi:MAG: DUF4198 domain-containing protein, partial [Desulfonauticus sp.]|nr:DUF4198 domain-containing protein [Desulfonauticus sp.]